MGFARRGCRARRFCGTATFTVLALSLVATAKDTPETHTTWSTYLGSPDGSHYTALRQIDRSNVGRLQVAWSYDSGSEQPYAFNPIVDGRTMYVLAKNSSIVALDATTGKEQWTYRSRSLGPRMEGHRALNFLQSHDGAGKLLPISAGNTRNSHNASKV